MLNGFSKKILLLKKTFTVLIISLVPHFSFIFLVDSRQFT